MRSLLPPNPNYTAACDFIDSPAIEPWHPVLAYITQKHQLGESRWQRISEGGNALFRGQNASGNGLILKLVPPNWRYQGEAEAAALSLLQNQTSLAIPSLAASGEQDNWFYVVMNQLPGVSLADVWGGMNSAHKLYIVRQLADFIVELHSLDLPDAHPLKPSWHQYHQKLLDDCIARHTRKQLAPQLVDQITDYLAASPPYFDDDATFFIHMDLHPWNLMVEEKGNGYQLSGVLDFGDAVIGNSRLLELATPLIFLCQGDPALTATLLEHTKVLSRPADDTLQHALMATSLIRPACDFNFVLSQVPVTGPRDNWQQIAKQLFPITD
ncbi:phosphotransferase family protein [Corallincola platygyrae]|uniref:Phosphotransferase family protein n=1 Tax=Corallincola platygyrae TaxID=1193278 RepID=A0ABW4XK92_9GAMM